MRNRVKLFKQKHQIIDGEDSKELLVTTIKLQMFY